MIHFYFCLYYCGRLDHFCLNLLKFNIFRFENECVLYISKSFVVVFLIVVIDVVFTASDVVVVDGGFGGGGWGNGGVEPLPMLLF